MAKKKISELDSFTGNAANFVIVGVDVVVVTLRRREQMIPAAVCFEQPDEEG